MDKIQQFIQQAPLAFNQLIQSYGYKYLGEIKSELNGEVWSVRLVYLNEQLQLKIILEQAPYYSDYGYSMTIVNLLNHEQVIVQSVDSELQDPEGEFIMTAAKWLFESHDALALVSGLNWVNYDRVLYLG